MKKLFFLLLFISSFTHAQQSYSIFIEQLANEILTNGKAYDNLYYLTKKIGNRLAGSTNILQAEQWGAQIFLQYGADTVFMQPCKVPVWQRGTKDFANLYIGNKKIPLTALALGNSVGSNSIINAPLLVVQNFEELEKRKNEVSNKVVYFNQAFKVTNIQPFKSYGETGIYRRFAPSMAAKYGALAVLIRSLTEEPNYAHTGSTVYNDSFPKIPAMAVSNKSADVIWSNKNNATLKVSLQTHGKFYDSVINHNVIATIKGTLYPHQYITVGGHLDSWDVGEGAHDDGAGIVQTIEILRAFKALGYQPKHTIRFVLFANEENGLMGGKTYAAKAFENKEEHVFALESDAGGFTPRSFGFNNINTSQLNKLNTWLPLLQPYGIDKFSNSGGGADINPLKQYFKNIVLAGLQPDAQRYFDYHHAPNDTFEQVNKRELLLGAINMAALLYLVDKYMF